MSSEGTTWLPSTFTDVVLSVPTTVNTRIYDGCKTLSSMD